jgi:hypothetical protein
MGIFGDSRGKPASGRTAVKGPRAAAVADRAAELLPLYSSVHRGAEYASGRLVWPVGAGEAGPSAAQASQSGSETAPPGKGVDHWVTSAQRVRRVVRSAATVGRAPG